MPEDNFYIYYTNYSADNLPVYGCFFVIKVSVVNKTFRVTK